MGSEEKRAIEVDVLPGDWHPEATVRIVLDPKTRRVFDVAIVGGGMPEYLWHRRAWELGRVSPSTVAEALESLLLDTDIQAELASLCDAYDGERFVVPNCVGSWSIDEDDEALLDERWTARFEELPSRWSAEEYLAPAQRDALDGLLDADSIATWAKSEVEAAPSEVYLDETDLVGWAEKVLRELAEDEAEEIERRNAALKLLGRDLLVVGRVIDGPPGGGGDAWDRRDLPRAVSEESNEDYLDRLAEWAAERLAEYYPDVSDIRVGRPSDHDAVATVYVGGQFVCISGTIVDENEDGAEVAS